MKTPEEMAGEWAERLAARPEHTGDVETLRRGIAEAAATQGSDPMLHVAFQPADRERFEAAARGFLSESNVRVESVGASPRGRAADGPKIVLYANLPGGVAHLPSSLFMKLLDAGLIRSFSWEPQITLSSSPPSAVTPLSVVGDPNVEQRLRAAGIASGLDLVSKISTDYQRARLSEVTGIPEPDLKRLAERIAGCLSPRERGLLERPPPFPFVSGIPFKEK